MNTSFNHIMIGKNLPIFDGSSRKLDYLDWFDTLEDYFEAVKPSDDVMCKLVASKLKGEARMWWTESQNNRFSKGESLINSWSRMRELLLERFLHTSRLTWFYKEENDDNEKHINCSMKGMLGAHGNNTFEEIMVDDPCHTEEVRQSEVINKINECLENGETQVGDIIEGTTNTPEAGNCEEESSDDDLEERIVEEQLEEIVKLKPAAYSTQVTLESDISNHDEKHTLSSLGVSGYIWENRGHKASEKSESSLLTMDGTSGHNQLKGVNLHDGGLSFIYDPGGYWEIDNLKVQNLVRQFVSLIGTKIGNEFGSKLHMMERGQSRRQTLWSSNDVLEDEMFPLSHIFDPGVVTKREDTFASLISKVEAAYLSPTEVYKKRMIFKHVVEVISNLSSFISHNELLTFLHAVVKFSKFLFDPGGKWLYRWIVGDARALLTQIRSVAQTNKGHVEVLKPKLLKNTYSKVNIEHFCGKILDLGKPCASFTSMIFACVSKKILVEEEVCKCPIVEFETFLFDPGGIFNPFDHFASSVRLDPNFCVTFLIDSVEPDVIALQVSMVASNEYFYTFTYFTGTTSLDMATKFRDVINLNGLVLDMSIHHHLVSFWAKETITYANFSLHDKWKEKLRSSKSAEVATRPTYKGFKGYCQCSFQTYIDFNNRCARGRAFFREEVNDADKNKNNIII